MPVIDIHTHGIGGYETPGATPEDILRIAEIQGSHGISAIIPTIYSASIEHMRTDIAAVKKAMEAQAAEGNGPRPKKQGSRLSRPSTRETGDMNRQRFWVHISKDPFSIPHARGLLTEILFCLRKHLIAKNSWKDSVMS